MASVIESLPNISLKTYQADENTVYFNMLSALLGDFGPDLRYEVTEALALGGNSARVEDIFSKTRTSCRKSVESTLRRLEEQRHVDVDRGIKPRIYSLKPEDYLFISDSILRGRLRRFYNLWVGSNQSLENRMLVGMELYACGIALSDTELEGILILPHRTIEETLSFFESRGFVEVDRERPTRRHPFKYVLSNFGRIEFGEGLDLGKAYLDICYNST
ncbi:MAG: hypothetical protein ACP5E4_00735 [Candidatus Aenigmatarchaeota archaeon]